MKYQPIFFPQSILYLTVLILILPSFSFLCTDHLRFLPPFLESDVREGLPTHILQEMLKRDDVTTAHLRHMLLHQEIHGIPGKPPFEGNKVSAADLMQRRLGDEQVFKKLYDYGMKIESSDCVLALQLFQNKALDGGVYKFVFGKQKQKQRHRDVPEVRWLTVLGVGFLIECMLSGDHIASLWIIIWLSRITNIADIALFSI